MIQEVHRYFGREIENLKPRYMKLNLWMDDKENRNQMQIEELIEDLDPQRTPPYAEQIFDYLKISELQYTVKEQYMTEQHQGDLNARMRAILVDWLVDVHLKFKLKPETLFMTIQLIDRYLAIVTTTRQQLQLVGVACLMIASKYEEIYPPELKEFVFITDNAYSRTDVLQMEGQILSTLNFQITQPSSYGFLQRYGEQLDNKNILLAQYLLELAFLDIKFITIKASLLAAASVYLVHKIRKVANPWSYDMIQLTQFDESQLRNCAKDLCLSLQAADKSQLQAVRKKFSSTKFQEVSRIRVERQSKS